jgi:aspartyl-tRNA(Asn)/glutamyl-tRNA(Gln) amidotransferase subunit A
MNDPVASEVLSATILAGTVAAKSDRSSDLPPAWLDTPEPGWAERDYLALAPPQTPTQQPALPRLPKGLAVYEYGIGELQAAYAAGVTNPVAVIEALVARIAMHPTGANAVLAMIEGAENDARDSAARIAKDEARPLEGIPFGVKDIIDVAGASVTGGSLLTGDRVARMDAAVVARLRAQGAIPLAMLATTEFACGSAHNPRYGAVRNPWNSSRWTGGSSTGSGAMLAARMLPLALGTDTGGSIRVPAAFCGICGLKPTRGLVPRTGVMPLSWTLDHIGPMARSVNDLRRVIPFVAGPDGIDPTAVGHYAAEQSQSDVKGLRIGVPGGWFVELQDQAVLSAWQEALAVFEKLGATLVPVDIGDIAAAHADGYLILMSELASLQEFALDKIEDFDAGARARIEQGLAFSATDYLRALRRRPLVIRKMLAALDDVDVLITPGLGGEAAFLEDMTVMVDGVRHPLQMIIPRNTMIFDYTGLPALMLPSGQGSSGLPVAIQIVGKPFADALCLSLGSLFQEATEHHRRAPPDPTAA